RGPALFPRPLSPARKRAGLRPSDRRVPVAAPAEFASQRDDVRGIAATLRQLQFLRRHIMAQPRPILLCTVGTSLFFPNLKGLADQLAAGKLAEDRRPLAEAYRDK